MFVRHWFKRFLSYICLPNERLTFREKKVFKYIGLFSNNNYFDTDFEHFPSDICLPNERLTFREKKVFKYVFAFKK